MKSTTKSSPGPNASGSSPLPLEQAAHLQAMIAGNASWPSSAPAVLLCLYLSLLSETLSPDLITLALYRARDMSDALGIDRDEFNSIVKTAQDYWKRNRGPLASMF